MSTDGNRLTFRATSPRPFPSVEWEVLRKKLSKLFEIGDEVTIYALPEPLIEALNSEARGVISDHELDVEFELTQFLDGHHAVGVDGNKLIQSALFSRPPIPEVSEEDVRELGWEQFGLDAKSANQQLAIAEQRARDFHDQLVAYAGWLVTNSEFLKEVSELRESDEQLQTPISEGAADTLSNRMRDFLARWQLAAMSSWDLPLPQGPNLSGIEHPRSARAPAARIELPLTTRVAARLPLREILDELQQQETPPHLAGWAEVVRGDQSNSLGMRRFRNILPIRFFQGIVLASRYRDRFVGSLGALDRVFGVYLGLSAESARQTRLEIQRRLGS